jgi:hypothetical protein
VTDQPTTAEPAVDCSIGRFRLLEKQGRQLVLGKPGTEYQVQVTAEVEVAAAAGDWLTGRIVTQPVRIDVISAGGRLIEPLQGRPRRVQGTVCALDQQRNALVVKAALPLVLLVPANQRLDQFQEGQMVSCDVKPGAVFEPV